MTATGYPEGHVPRATMRARVWARPDASMQGIADRWGELLKDEDFTATFQEISPADAARIVEAIEAGWDQLYGDPFHEGGD